jgi:outer membrane protein assembly factor BamB
MKSILFLLAFALSVVPASAAEPADSWVLLADERFFIHDARVGQDVVYVVGGGDTIVTTQVDDEGHPVDPRDRRFDRMSAWTVTAVDARTGARRWSRLLLSKPGFGIDPRDDSLWVWRRTDGYVEQFSADDGRKLFSAGLPKHRHASKEFRGMRQGGARIWSRSRGREGSDVGREWDLDEEVELEDMPAPYSLSPDGLRVMRSTRDRGDTVYYKVPPLAQGGRKSAFWEYEVGGSSPSPAMWTDDGHVLIPVGDGNERGRLDKLDAATGERVFSVPLGTPVSRVGAGDYDAPQNGSWPNLVTDGRIAVVPGKASVAGRYFLHIVDVRDGRHLRRVLVPRPPRGQMGLIDGRLILPTRDGVFAIHLDHIGIRPTKVERDVMAAGNPAAAAKLLDKFPRTIDTLRYLAQHGPDRAVAWQTLELVVTGETNAPALRNLGLLWRLPVGPVRVELAHLGGSALLVHTTGGAQIDVDVSGTEPNVLRWHWLERALKFLRFDGRRYLASDWRHADVLVRAFADPPVLPTSDPLVGVPREPTDLPAEWNTRTGRDGAPRQIGGVWSRPKVGGGVHVAEPDGKGGWNVYVRPGTRSLGAWSYREVGDRMYGVGNGGIFAIDDDLRPTGPRLFNGAIHSVSAIAATNDAVAVLGYEKDAHKRRRAGIVPLLLEIWDAEGKTLYRSERFPRSYMSFGTTFLQPMADGFLASGPVLLWAPTNSTRPSWVFDMNPLDPDSGNNDPHMPFQFGVPRIVGDRVVVASPGGGIFCFDVDTITSWSD